MDEFEGMIRGRLRQPETPVPEAVDASILGAAREAATAFRRRQRMRLLRVAVAAAAVLLLGFWLVKPAAEPRERAFDVVDAWRVTVGLERDEGRFDLDRDGSVDREDAELMLSRIVALQPRRKS